MCNCNRMPSAICDPEYWNRGLPFQGIAKHAERFQTFDTQLLEPTLDYELRLYKCSSCGQHWYIECAPEEELYPFFAMKCQEDIKPTIDQLNREKQLLCILAHDGHDLTTCRQAGCEKKKLKGRELCELHCSIL